MFKKHTPLYGTPGIPVRISGHQPCHTFDASVPPECDRAPLAGAPALHAQTAGHAARALSVQRTREAQQLTLQRRDCY